MACSSRLYRNFDYSEVTVTFQIRYSLENSDLLCLAVTGSTPELGHWDVANCLIADELPRGSGKWSMSVMMPARSQFFWKWLVITRDKSRVIRWEHIANREVSIGNESRILNAEWDEPAQICPQRHHSSTTLFGSFLRAVTNKLNNHQFAWCEIL